MLSPERDEQLAQMTEHRVTTFAHDLVPDYLRTKLEPMAENKMLQLEHKAASLTYENAQVRYKLNKNVFKFRPLALLPIFCSKTYIYVLKTN